MSGAGRRAGRPLRGGSSAAWRSQPLPAASCPRPARPGGRGRPRPLPLRSRAQRGPVGSPRGSTRARNSSKQSRDAAPAPPAGRGGVAPCHVHPGAGRAPAPRACARRLQPRFATPPSRAARGVDGAAAGGVRPRRACAAVGGGGGAVRAEARREERFVIVKAAAGLERGAARAEVRDGAGELSASGKGRGEGAAASHPPLRLLSRAAVLMLL